MVSFGTGLTGSAARLASARFGGLLLAAASADLLGVALVAPDHGRGAVVMVAIFVASLVSGIAGFAFSAIAGAMLFHLMDDPVRIVAIMITCSIANQTVMTWMARHDIDWAGLWRYCAAGILGLPVGIWVLLHADRTLYTHILGGFLLAYGGYMLLRKAVVVRHPPLAADMAAGFLGGIAGGAAGFPSVSVSIWCSMKGWTKARQRAVVQPFILAMQLGSFIAIALLQRSHPGNAGFDPHDMVYVPASLLGTLLSMALYGRLTDVQFGRAVNLLLIVSGFTFAL
jgi:uncharacterized membrane protein YfcA